MIKGGIQRKKKKVLYCLINHNFYENKHTLWLSKQALPQVCKHLRMDLIGILLSIELYTPSMKFFIRGKKNILL